MTDPDYFTLAEIRAFPDMSDSGKFTDARVLAAAAHITGIIEAEVGTSFIARTVTNEVHSGGAYGIQLNHWLVQSVTSATENGTAVTDTLGADKFGVLFKIPSGSYVPGWWASGFRNITVTYTYGYSTTPPDDVKEMALVATRMHLLRTASDSANNARLMSRSTDMGVEQYSVAGEKRPTGYPEVDAMIFRWKRKLGVMVG